LPVGAANISQAKIQKKIIVYLHKMIQLQNTHRLDDPALFKRPLL